MAEGLFASRRRGLAAMIVALLVVPALLMPVLPRKSVSPEENRTLAPAPTWPDSADSWRAAPRAVDAFLADHFGLREPLMRAASAGWRSLGGEAAGAQAVEGRDGWMFLADGLLASTGQSLDPARAADYASFVCEAVRRLRAQGAKVAFSLAPSPGEIYPEAAPAWAGPARRPTQYDLILARVEACGVPTVDLRPPLIAAKSQALVYRKLDTHWTLRGSLIAHNRLAERLGRPDWAVAPQDLQWGMVTLDNGDLPRLLDQDARSEIVEIHSLTALPPGARKVPLPDLEQGEMAPFLVETGRSGPTVVVVGDSFTADPLPPYLARVAGRVAWIHQSHCRLDWRIMTRLKPDYVVWLPAEREAACAGARPAAWG